MSRWVTPNGSSASITALATAGVEPIVAASPMPLAPSGLRGRGGGVVGLEHRETVGLRDGVVDQGAGEQLAVVVVVDLLPERLTDALGQTAVDLTVTSIGLMMLPQSSTET